ncbi:MAG: gluconate 2-dehydrogenase subunit 3 family protein [Bacteroidales bacterium]|nr:gluconate 2-dehydrogenase subunit 3 family protein [Bacteroidales bacterium]
MQNKTESDWHFSRRKFIKGALTIGLMSQIPFAVSCVQTTELDEVLIKIGDKTYTIELKFIQDVQNIIFPEDEFGPGASQLKSDSYLIWVLKDDRIDPWDGTQIIKGFSRLNNRCKKQYKKKFIDITKAQQEELIAQISLMDWGQSWLSKLLTLIFESMFANPNYGSNPDGIGWKWLNHNAGFPQPTEQQIYPTILNTIQHNKKS